MKFTSLNQFAYPGSTRDMKNADASIRQVLLGNSQLSEAYMTHSQ